MKKLQAAMRDVAARSWKERKLYFKVGSVFKGCLNCGELDTEYRPVRYKTGHNVFRSYVPANVGWTYWCWDCGAKDAAAWKNAYDLGLPAIVGSTEAKEVGRARRRAEYELRNEAVKMETKASPAPTPAPQNAEKIAEIEARINALIAQLKK